MSAVILISELQRAIAERPEAATLFGFLLDAFSRAGMRFDGACWHVSDPLTGLLARTGVIGAVPGDHRTAIELEFFTEDIAKLDEIAQRSVPVASLIDETHGSPHISARWREMIYPDGHADELRAAFVDSFGRWGSINLFRAGTPFTQPDRDLVASVIPLISQALRISAAAGPAPGAAAPGVLVLDASDRLESIDPTANVLLHSPEQPLPGAVQIASATVRHTGTPQRARMQTAEGWLLLDATPLGGSGQVAVIVQPAPRATLVDVHLRAAGLTEREREIALCVIRGESTEQIVGALYLSPWTVQDHLKAIFDKTGTRSRRELVALLLTTQNANPLPVGVVHTNGGTGRDE